MEHAPNPSTALARVVVDELVGGGVRLIVLSPGSRSAALAIAAVGHPGVSTVLLLDERSAAFYALGRAKSTGEPVAVMATSGTAPANWFPAVIEADAACVPVIFISADRPTRLRGVGANQTIDQVEMFGKKVRFFAGIEAPDDTDRVSEWRSTLRRAMAAATPTAVGARPGPAHINVAFEEPTVPVADDGRSKARPYAHRLDPLPEVIPDSEPEPPVVDSHTEVPSRGLVVAGDGNYDRDGLLEAAGRLGWPVLATALSGLRGRKVLGAYGHRLRTPPGPEETPEIVVAVGATGPDDRLERLIGSASSRFRVDRWGRHIDPGLFGTVQVRDDPVRFLAGLRSDPDPGWVEMWEESDRRVRSALDEHLAGAGAPTTARVAWYLNRVERNVFVVGSSLPIREADAHLTVPGPVVANRGASGIDGFVSLALGAASAHERTLGFCGDLSLLHDSNGWLCDTAHDLTVVVVNNQGGGLFDLLPQRQHAPHFERLFIAPHGRSLADLARLHGLNHEMVTEIQEVAPTVADAIGSGGLNLIEIPVDREDDLALNRELTAVAAAALHRS